MRLNVLIIISLLLSALVFADFKPEKVEVTVSDIDKDGGARVQEVIMFIIVGDLSYSVYDSGLYNNDLSFWSTQTQLKELRLHVNPNKVDIVDFRLRPQPRKSCNSFSNSCRGELIIDYKALPHYSNGERINDTGLFFVKKEKPRTTTYDINPQALLFTTTNIGDIIIDRGITLKIILPKNSIVNELNPFPEDVTERLPQETSELSWTNIILVRFVLEFQVEDSLGKEVTNFFGDVINAIDKLLRGEHGIAIIGIAIILMGSYIYLKSIEFKKE